MRKALAAWDRFWFTPRSTSTAAVVRIGGALVLLGWAVTIGRDVLSFFGPDAIMPRQPDYRASGLRGVWSVLGASPSSTVVIGVYAAFVVGALCLLVGFHSRLAALTVFVAMVSFTRRNPSVFNSGDALLRVLSFYLLAVPGGAALSVDRWRRARRGGGAFWEFPARALWPLRLMQVQLSVAYLAAVWAKVGGSTWRDGTAVSFALRVGFIRRLPVPDQLTRSLLVSNVLSYATLATELALGLLVWNRRLRPRVLLLGVAFHLALDYAFRVGFFSYGMFVLYLAFVPPETMDAWLAAGRNRLARRRAPGRTVGAELDRDGDDEGPTVKEASDRDGVTQAAEAVVADVGDGVTTAADAVVGDPSPGAARS